MRSTLILAAVVLTALWSFPAPAEEDAAIEALARRAAVQYENVPRKVLAFYYPWYGNAGVPGGSGRWSHWQGVDEKERQIASSTHYPELGPYDSHDPKTIEKHAEWSKQAGLDGWIVSWWGSGDFTDRAMGRILDACRNAGLEVTVYYETVRGDKTPENAAREIVDLLTAYAKHPAWLRLDGKPVVFIYGRAVGELGLSGWLSAIDQVNRQYEGGAVLLGDQMSRAAARVFDGIHTYNTVGSLAGRDVHGVKTWCEETFPEWVALAARRRRISTLTLIPGYDDTKIRKPGIAAARFEGESYRAQWEAAIAALPDWVLITSFNEWHEGSEIEPSAEFGHKYLELTAEFAARFKKAPARPPAERPKPKAPLTEKQQAALGKLRGAGVGLLPGADLDLLLWLLEQGVQPRSLSPAGTAGLDEAAARQMPILVYAGDETLEHGTERPGEVLDGLRRYLQGGGLLVCLPTGPMPMYYDRDRNVVDGARRIGLPLAVGGPRGGWERPPQGKTLKIVRAAGYLENLPAEFPFPDQDPRWRPL
ncbi:MAG: hypothetical protein GYA33_11340, partial [Thermogutta sp.]|nr:hypothetical protein [Thermogutta sp.]